MIVNCAVANCCHNGPILSTSVLNIAINLNTVIIFTSIELFLLMPNVLVQLATAIAFGTIHKFLESQIHSS